MAFRTVFERVELKYIISREQKNMLLGEMEGYMSADSYGRSVIRNIYYDTDSYLLTSIMSVARAFTAQK